MEKRPALFAVLVDEKELRTRYQPVADYISRDYEPMADIDVEQVGRLRILVHRGQVARSVDHQTGWPCFT
jgi:hypothetical protein